MKKEILLSESLSKEDFGGPFNMALQELNALKLDLQEEYNRLLELLKQGNVDTVLQIISHRKAVNSIKNK